MKRTAKMLSLQSLLFVLPIALILILVIPMPVAFATKDSFMLASTSAEALASKSTSTSTKGSTTPEAVAISSNTTSAAVTTASAVDVKPVVPLPRKATVGKSTYLVHIDLEKQLMTVFETKNGVNKTIRTMPCATGKKYTPTPKGIFKMKPVGKFLYDRKYRCYLKYVIQFKGSYLIHSVPVSSTGKVLDGTIGKPASHGCVRLGITDSKWLYQLPSGTKVLIE